MRTQTVPVNVWEAPEAIVVVAPLPAVTPDDVGIELRDNTLRFWASLRSAAPRDYLVHEWDYGGYEREIEIPARARAAGGGAPAGYGSAIEASLGHGQLAIRVLRGVATGPISATLNES